MHKFRWSSVKKNTPWFFHVQHEQCATFLPAKTKHTLCRQAWQHSFVWLWLSMRALLTVCRQSLPFRLLPHFGSQHFLPIFTWLLLLLLVAVHHAYNIYILSVSAAAFSTALVKYGRGSTERTIYWNLFGHKYTSVHLSSWILVCCAGRARLYACMWYAYALVTQSDGKLVFVCECCVLRTRMHMGTISIFFLSSFYCEWKFVCMHVCFALHASVRSDGMDNGGIG